MAATIVTVQSALQIVAQLIPLIQSAVASGATVIDADVWAEAINARNDALTKLDADIASAKAEGR
jgi:hypothetical protein